MSFLSTDALFCCCNSVNFPTVGLIKEHLNLNLNAEFNQEFSEDLSPLLLQTYQASFENGSFPPLFNYSHITLIHKKGKDPLMCKKYHPIS